MSSRHRKFKLVVVDNASPGGAVAAARDWAAGRRAVEFPSPAADPDRVPPEKPLALAEFDAASARALAPGALPQLSLVHAGCNLGFAGGVNLGLEVLARDPEVGAFWLLNPDGMAEAGTLGAFAEAIMRNPDFGLMSGRIVYCEPEGRVQNDGGRVDWLTGICRPVNIGRRPQDAPPPEGAALDYVSGASLVASRRFVETVGPMEEDYFLYYEEVDWAARRGDLPIVYVPGAVVHHHGGASIGTARLNRLASPFSNYFTYRNRMRFMRRFRPWALPTTYLYSMAKIAHLALKGAWPEAAGACRGLHGMAPPRAVRERVGPDAEALAFRPKRGMASD